MLHMLVGTHSADTCAFAVPEWRNKALADFKRRDEVTKKLGITLQGSWVNMPNHTMYMVFDAPNAHVVNQMAIELGLMDWNTIVVSAVMDFDEVQKVLQQRKT